MQCLYCGKGIGPIRQLRDLEFCSEAHRTQFRERYRQQVYEALAQEPAPVRGADFIGLAPATAGPAPSLELRVLTKPVSAERLPSLNAAVAAGGSVERPAWVVTQRLAAMPTRLAWQASTAPVAPSVRTVSFPIAIQPPNGSVAGAASTELVAGNSTRPPAAAPRMAASTKPAPRPVALPDAAQIHGPLTAAPSAPQLQAAAPMYGDPAAIGPVPATVAAPMTLASSAAIAGPAAPAGQVTASETGLSPVEIDSQPRSHDSRIAQESRAASSVRHIGITVPKPPAVAASSSSIAAIRQAQSVLPELRLSPAKMRRAFGSPALLAGQPFKLPTLPRALAPAAVTAESQINPLAEASPTWHASWNADGSSRLAPLGIEYSAAPIGALAGVVQPGSNAVQQAAGNRNLRSAEALPAAPMPVAIAQPELHALPAEIGSAAPRLAEAPAPAAPPAASPAWDDARAVLPRPSLVPLANVALPHIACLPAPAGAVEGPGVPLRPDVGRLVRSCAVLWTLRVVRMCNPVFRTEAIKTDLRTLLHTDWSTPYTRKVEDHRPAKSNVRTLRRLEPQLSNKIKWQYIAAAAAALLLAGVLRPSKGFGDSLPWSGVSLHQWISQRASRDFADDFRAGLNQWQGVQPKWPKSWSYSTDGFIHPGQLALYRPSVPLSDYHFEFMAQIENKSVDWVVRAKDADNYYALKFTVLQGGPRPIMAMVHYPVIGGQRGSRIQTPLRMMIHANTPYRVTVDVKGNRYRTFIEDQEADFWTDDRLKTGGVGFFSEASEHARVYWVKLESHPDILGRICGLLSGKGNDVPKDKEIRAMDYRPAMIADVSMAFGLGRVQDAFRLTRPPM